MKYASIRKLDISNGEGVGIALFVQGCPFHCKNCFNEETWDFSSGKLWTENVKNKFLQLANRNYIRRVSVLGGEPLATQNIHDVCTLLKEIRSTLPKKVIWLYSGYTWDYIWNEKNNDLSNASRQIILRLCNVFIDGQYIDELRDLNLRWCGSSNQRVINVQKSLQKGELILWDRSY